MHKIIIACACNDAYSPYCGTMITLFINPHVDMRAHSFPELWIFYPVALSFIYLTIKICEIISHYECVFFQWMGCGSVCSMSSRVM